MSSEGEGVVVREIRLIYKAPVFLERVEGVRGTWCRGGRCFFSFINVQETRRDRFDLKRGACFVSVSVSFSFYLFLLVPFDAR